MSNLRLEDKKETPAANRCNNIPNQSHVTQSNLSFFNQASAQQTELDDELIFLNSFNF